MRLAAFTFLIAVFSTLRALAHPIPDIPVQGHFTTGGAATLFIEVDPRCFAPDPNAAASLLPAVLRSYTEEERADLRRKADALVKRSVEFYFEPVGRLQPEFSFEFTGEGRKPLSTKDDDVVLTGEWKTTVACRADRLEDPRDARDEARRGVPKLHRRPGASPAERALPRRDQLHARPHPARQPRPRPPRRRARFRPSVPRGCLEHVRQFSAPGLHPRAARGTRSHPFRARPFPAQPPVASAAPASHHLHLAHSVTLALATIGWVHVPSSIVEPIIALSIAAVALENIFHPRYTPWRLVIVFIFGLVHGLGFASALSGSASAQVLLAVG